MNFRAVKKNIFFVFLGSFICFLGYLLIFFGLQEGFSPVSKEKEKIADDSEARAAQEAAEDPFFGKTLQERMEHLKGVEATLWVYRGDEEPRYIVTLGRKDGMKEGIVLDIYDNGKVIGRLQTRQVHKEISLGKLLSLNAGAESRSYYAVKVAEKAS